MATQNQLVQQKYQADLAKRNQERLARIAAAQRGIVPSKPGVVPTATTPTVNPYTNMQLSETQRRILASQQAQLGEPQFQRAIQQSQTGQIAQTVQQDMQNLQAMQQGVPQTPQPQRTGTLPGSVPTPMQPAVPISARGGNQVVPSYTPSGLPVASNTMPYYGQEQQRPMTLEELSYASPEQRLAFQKQGFDQQANQQFGLLNNMYGQQQDILGQREQGIQTDINALKAEGFAPEDEAKLKQLEAETALQQQMAIAAQTKAAGQQSESAAESLAFSGFARSTKAADIQADIQTQLSTAITQINLQAAGQVGEMRTALLEKENEKISKLEDRLMQTQDAKDELKLSAAKEQAKLMADLFTQDPYSADNMLKVADQLKTARIEEEKAAKEEEKELRTAARDNLTFMTENFGSSFVQNMSDEELANMAYNLRMPPSMLKNMGPTMAEYEQAWQEAKYVQDQDFELLKIGINQDFSARMADIGYQQDLAKLDIGYGYDLNKLYLGEQFKTDADARKYSGVSYGEYAAAGSAADGSAIYFDQGTTGPGGSQLVGYNPKLGNAYPNGYKKSPSSGPNGLGGQCAYEAQQITNCPRVGNTLQEKKNSVAKLAQQGKAFYPGQEVAKVGNTVITNESATWGHAAVIIGITKDGKWQLGEFNRGGDLRWTNTRIMDPNSGSIVGVIKSQPRPEYQVAKDATKLASDAINKNPLVKAGMNLAGGTLIGQLLGRIPEGIQRGIAQQGGQQMLASQLNSEQQYDQGIVDEQGRNITPDRQAIRSGSYSDSQINDIYTELKGAVNAGAVPREKLDMFNQDLVFSKKPQITPEQQAAKDYGFEKTKVTLSTLDELITNSDMAGFVGSYQAMVPGTAHYAYARKLETIKANIAFGELTAMREASKTGGALGAVSDREGRLLESVLGSLDIGLPPEELKKNLQAIKESIARWKGVQSQQGLQGQMTQSSGGGYYMGLYGGQSQSAAPTVNYNRY